MKRPGVLGWYASYRNEMVICQERASANGQQVAWTAEDYDTLRHEAQHLIQDCVDKKQNGQLHPVYKDPIGLAKATLSSNTLAWIVGDGYGNLPPAVQVLELEAFAVAELNDPMEQVRDIRNYCY